VLFVRYNDVIQASELVDQSPVRGCMVIRPWGMGIWDEIRRQLDGRIAGTGATNAYFPLLIPKSFIAKEAHHVQGFAKECAVVTHHRLCLSEDGKDLIPDPDAALEVRK
jgi:prolyl-tRNA synthetase